VFAAIQIALHCYALMHTTDYTTLLNDSLDQVAFKFDHKKTSFWAFLTLRSFQQLFLIQSGFFFFFSFVFWLKLIASRENYHRRVGWGCCRGEKRTKRRLFARGRRHINRHFQLSAPHYHAHASAHAAPKSKLKELACLASHT
jgi:hypothetical protein